MSVLIKGMEMPKSCLICVCDIPKGNCDLWRNQTPEEHRRERHPDCQLIEVPTPHGRLIDADRLKRNIYANLPAALQDLCPGFCNIVDMQKTVIESEGE